MRGARRDPRNSAGGEGGVSRHVRPRGGLPNLCSPAERAEPLRVQARGQRPRSDGGCGPSGRPRSGEIRRGCGGETTPLPPRCSLGDVTTPGKWHDPDKSMRQVHKCQAGVGLGVVTSNFPGEKGASGVIGPVPPTSPHKPPRACGPHGGGGCRATFHTDGECRKRWRGNGFQTDPRLPGSGESPASVTRGSHLAPRPHARLGPQGGPHGQASSCLLCSWWQWGLWARPSPGARAGVLGVCRGGAVPPLGTPGGCSLAGVMGGTSSAAAAPGAGTLPVPRGRGLHTKHQTVEVTENCFWKVL